MYCSQCGLCEMFSCPQGLNPRTLIGVAKGALRKNKVTLPEPDFDGVSPEREFRTVPMARLITRLGLQKYDRPAPYKDMSLSPGTLKVMLSQHIGAPAKCVVAEGDSIEKGALLAEAAGGLSLPVHSPAAGVIKKVTDSYVVISNSEKG